MTTLIPFTPSNSSSPPFSVSVTLDSTSYQLIATWNLAGQRWYAQLQDQSGNVVWMGALVGSPLSSNIYLALGIFETSTLLYRADTGNFEITP
jgi:hypothetical protein